MAREEQQYITNPNDRQRLTLYHYISDIRNLSLLESYEFKKLNNVYVDNHLYTEYLNDILMKRRFISATGNPSYQDENGHWRIDNSSTGNIITALGEKALKSGLLSSETKKEVADLLKDWLPIISSLIALGISILALKK